MRRRARLPITTPEVNLVPLLDMVSLLIMMLLVNAQIGTYSELETHLAGAAAEQSTEALGLQVDITREGFLVSWSRDGARQERSFPCGESCADPSRWDTDGLRGLAQELKRTHQAEQQVVLTPSEGVAFEVVIRAMDALRSDIGGLPMFTDLVVGT